MIHRKDPRGNRGPSTKQLFGTFTVRTNHGWGWRCPQAPECPSFGSQAEAQRYADLRNGGMPHLRAWDTVEAERFAGVFGPEPSADPE